MKCSTGNVSLSANDPPKANQDFENDPPAKWPPPSPSQAKNDQSPIKNVTGHALIKKVQYSEIVMRKIRYCLWEIYPLMFLNK